MLTISSVGSFSLWIWERRVLHRKLQGFQYPPSLFWLNVNIIITRAHGGYIILAARNLSRNFLNVFKDRSAVRCRTNGWLSATLNLFFINSVVLFVNIERNKSLLHINTNTYINAFFKWTSSIVPIYVSLFQLLPNNSRKILPFVAFLQRN